MNIPLPHRPATPRLIRALGVMLALLPLIALAMISRAAPRERTANPHGALKEDCGTCHGAGGWKPARIGPKFDHSRYGFRLEGAHADADCRACHKSLDFKRGEANCVACHDDVHRGELGVDCARCHGARSFIDPSRMIRAHSMTRFPLRGAHAGLECEQCHAPAAQGQLQFVNARSDCAACHMDDYRVIVLSRLAALADVGDPRPIIAPPEGDVPAYAAWSERFPVWRRLDELGRPVPPEGAGEDDLDPARYALPTMAARLESAGDPMRALLEVQPEVHAAVQRLEALLGSR